MKKVARLRVVQEESPGLGLSSENVSVRTTGRIKKPKAVFDPSDNYLPRSYRPSISGSTSSSNAGGSATAISLTGRKETQSQSMQLQDPQYNKRLSLSSNASASSVVSDINHVDVCVVCSKPEAKRGAWASKNKLITCLDCSSKVHKMCLKVDFADMDALQKNFKCENCRSCDICDSFPDCDSKVNEPLVTCCNCVKSYHRTCHVPKVIKQEEAGQWKCRKCQPPTANGDMLPVKTIREIIGDEPPKANHNIEQPQIVNIAAAAAEAKNAAAKRSLQQKDTGGVIGNGSEPDVGSSSGSTGLAQKRQKSSGDNSQVLHYSPYEPLDVPDVRDWSIGQVVEYIEKFFPEEAHLFREHEIDGASLLLLKRSDIIKKFPLKLGPSLRIYSLILKLQAQLNCPTLGWNCDL